MQRFLVIAVVNRRGGARTGEMRQRLRLPIASSPYGNFVYALSLFEEVNEKINVKKIEKKKKKEKDLRTARTTRRERNKYKRENKKKKQALKRIDTRLGRQIAIGPAPSHSP